MELSVIGQFGIINVAKLLSDAEPAQTTRKLSVTEVKGPHTVVKGLCGCRSDTEGPMEVKKPTEVKLKFSATPQWLLTLCLSLNL